MDELEQMQPEVYDHEGERESEQERQCESERYASRGCRCHDCLDYMAEADATKEQAA